MKNRNTERGRMIANLQLIAKALEEARIEHPSKPGTLRFFEQQTCGPVVVRISLERARQLATLLRELATGKTLSEATGLPSARGRPTNHSLMRKYFVEWLRLRAKQRTKKTAHNALSRKYKSLPSVERLDRWWNAQDKESRQLIVDLAEGRVYSRSKSSDNFNFTRTVIDISKVLKIMDRGAKRGKF
jgi:hypothetical protein